MTQSAQSTPSTASYSRRRSSPNASCSTCCCRASTAFLLLQQLRAQPSQKRTPVIVWTMKDLTADESATLAQHAEAVLTKGGGDNGSLLSQLANVLPKHSA